MTLNGSLVLTPDSVRSSPEGASLPVTIIFFLITGRNSTIRLISWVN